MPTISGLVLDSKTKGPIGGALVTAKRTTTTTTPDETTSYSDWTNDAGRFTIVVPPDQVSWQVQASTILGNSGLENVSDCHDVILCIKLDPSFQIEPFEGDKKCSSLITNRVYELELTGPSSDILDNVKGVEWHSRHAFITPIGKGVRASIEVDSPGEVVVEATVTLENDKAKEHPLKVPATPTTFFFNAAPLPDVTRVALQRASIRPAHERGLWTLIRANTRVIGFHHYHEFISRVLAHHPKDSAAAQFPTSGASERLQREHRELIPFGVGAYELLRTATELFLLLNCRVNTRRELHRGQLEEEQARLGRLTPTNLHELAKKFLGNNNYLQRVIDAAFPGEDKSDNVFADGVLVRNEPVLIELIWSYWHEEGMLAQSVNAISRRFQNQRSDTPRDPLAHFELDPLRPLNNILWGYVQDEYKRLTVPRRSQEYNHQYGLVLYGKANPVARAADPRSKFLESFHNLLHRASQFFKEDNDTTVIADGFPLLNALREVHLVLAQGAHNQFGDLPWTARVEMLIQEWIMARQETRDFLQSRVMVPYTEAWMPQVDTMKSIQGWTDVGVNHFRDLGTYGEQLLLSIRYGDWIDINDEDVAKNWARYWRPEIQSYLHSYRAVSGVDLTNPDSLDYTVPAVHLKRRLDAQARVR
jgi:hypothetical protein